MAPMSPSSLDLAGWETPQRIHMMTDMLFWGQRQVMLHMANLSNNIVSYYQGQHPDPFKRPIQVKALLDSLKRDVRLQSSDGDDWYLYNKLEVLPYPDMGLHGAVANLEAAVSAGMDAVICDGALCK